MGGKFFIRTGNARNSLIGQIFHGFDDILMGDDPNQLIVDIDDG